MNNDAAELHNHKDDENEWGDALETPPAMPRRNLDSMVSVRFSSIEAAALRNLAALRGQTLSQFIRANALQALHPSGEPAAVVRRSAPARLGTTYGFAYSAGQSLGEYAVVYSWKPESAICTTR